MWMEIEDRRTLSVAATSSLLGGRLKSEEQYSFSPRAIRTMENPGDPRRRFTRLALTGNEGTLQYGITLQQAGQGAATTPDLGMRELWGEWRAGITRMRTTFSETWNNVDRNPLLPRMTQIQERVLVALAPSAWPELSFSYARIAAASSLEPLGVAPQRNTSDSMESALAYTGATWNARASAAYIVSSDLLNPGIQTTGLAYGANGTYRLTPLLTLTPSINLRDDLQRWSGTRINNRGASMSVTYLPLPRLTVSTTAAYNATNSSDGLIDLSAFNARSAVTWSYEPISHVRTNLSLEASHKFMHDVVTPSRSVEDTMGLVRIEFTGS
jgi:hypothetical protein